MRGPAPSLAIAPFDSTTAKKHQAAWAKQLETKVEQKNTIGQTMVLIPPGEFLMGSTDEQVEAALKVAEELKGSQTDKDRIQKAERPQHRVVITKPFLMSATEVTVGQFRKFVEATKYVTEAEQYGSGNSADKTVSDKVKPEDRGLNWKSPGYVVTQESPASQISWNDACAFCAWLSSQEERTPWYRPDSKGNWMIAAHANGYRLPTEAEWEYACRAGTTTQYSFGDDHVELVQYGWSNKNAGGKSQPVALKLPNPFGLFDMHGNLQEWCQDAHDEKWYEKSPPNDPQGPAGSSRVIRGGGFYDHASGCRSAIRDTTSPSSRYTTLGFRIVRILDVPPSTVQERGEYALKFDGEKDFVAIPDFNFDGNPPLTIEGWITPLRVDQGGIKVIEVGDAGSPHFSLKYNGTEYHCNFSNGRSPSVWQIASVFIPKEVNRRDHVAVVWDGKSIQCFVNGKQGEPVKLKPNLVTVRPQGGMMIRLRQFARRSR